MSVSQSSWILNSAPVCQYECQSGFQSVGSHRYPMSRTMSITILQPNTSVSPSQKGQWFCHSVPTRNYPVSSLLVIYPLQSQNTVSQCIRQYVCPSVLESMCDIISQFSHLLLICPVRISISYPSYIIIMMVTCLKGLTIVRSTMNMTIHRVIVELKLKDWRSSFEVEHVVKLLWGVLVVVSTTLVRANLSQWNTEIFGYKLHFNTLF